MKDRLHIFGFGALLVLSGFIFAYQFINPSPPKTISIATGSESGAYYAYAQQYKALLAKQGITLNVVSTAGSVDNIKLLKEGEVDLAFVQSGTGRLQSDNLEQTHPGLVSLASVYYEPLWLFMRRSDIPVKTFELKGKRVAVGAEGSGTYALAKVLLETNEIRSENTTLLNVSGDEAAAQLKSGDIDYLFLVASVNAPVVNTLISDNQVMPFDFERAKAYTRRFRFLSTVELPRGVIDFGQDIPKKDLNLLSAAATLVTHEEIHPALATLLMQILTDVHREGGLLAEPGQFPSKNYLDFPLDASASRFFDYGPPLLQRYLPFWVAVLVNQFKVFLIPIIALMIPLMRILPPLYRWRVRSRIYRWYRHLREIEERLSDDLPEESLKSLKMELNLLQEDVTQQDAPLSYTDELYHLRTHIKLVKERLETSGQ
jgi:TRAP transporter TAXI family solute receptor